MSHSLSVQNRNPPLIYPVKLESDITIAAKTEELCNTLGYYLITGQLIGILRIITNVVLLIIAKAADLFSMLFCKKPYPVKSSSDHLAQIKRGFIELLPYGGKNYYQKSDELAIKNRKINLQDKEAKLNHQLFLEGLKAKKKASPHELKAIQCRQKMLIELKNKGKGYNS